MGALWNDMFSPCFEVLRVTLKEQYSRRTLINMHSDYSCGSYARRHAKRSWPYLECHTPLIAVRKVYFAAQVNNTARDRPPRHCVDTTKLTTFLVLHLLCCIGYWYVYVLEHPISIKSNILRGYLHLKEQRSRIFGMFLASVNIFELLTLRHQWVGFSVLFTITQQICSGFMFSRGHLIFCSTWQFAPQAPSGAVVLPTRRGTTVEIGRTCPIASDRKSPLMLPQTSLHLLQLSRLDLSNVWTSTWRLNLNPICGSYNLHLPQKVRHWQLQLVVGAHRYSRALAQQHLTRALGLCSSVVGEFQHRASFSFARRNPSCCLCANVAYRRPWSLGCASRARQRCLCDLNAEYWSTTQFYTGELLHS